MEPGLRHYLVITAGYWAFTLTDGAIRMLVVLYFHLLGYSPLQVAMLFLFYEFFGVVTNLVGGWLGSRIGLNLTMHIGMALQVLALSMLMAPDAWLGVAYVMAAQALSGIAKDLNKMSAKASIKTLLPDGGGHSRLFHWVAVLTGSKNALKGAGFFLGAALLQTPASAARWVCWRRSVAGTDCHLRAAACRARQGRLQTEIHPGVRQDPPRSTGCPPRAFFCLVRATSGSWWHCRCSCTRCWAGVSPRWAVFSRCG